MHIFSIHTNGVRGHDLVILVLRSDFLEFSILSNKNYEVCLCLCVSNVCIILMSRHVATLVGMNDATMLHSPLKHIVRKPNQAIIFSTHYTADTLFSGHCNLESQLL